ncbi:MAG TPA: hypothetical protein VMP08_13640 [Anaerolineae bacterium]|nr:hypothetical protein [Anaerolineae bacterium]
MFKKHRALLITLLIMLVGILVGMIACCAAFIEYYANRDASTRVNGYQVDFEYEFEMDVNVTHLKITRPDGKSTMIMRKVQGNCTRLTIQYVGAKLYFLCLEDTLSAETDYLDTETMLLYDGEKDNAPTPIDSLDFR